MEEKKLCPFGIYNELFLQDKEKNKCYLECMAYDEKEKKCLFITNRINPNEVNILKI